MKYLYFGIESVNNWIATKETREDKSYSHWHTCFFMAVMFWFNLMSVIYLYIGIFRDWRLPMEPKRVFPILMVFYAVILILIRRYFKGKDATIMEEMKSLSKTKRNIIIGLSFLYIVFSFFTFYYIVDLGHDVNVNR